MQIKTKTTIITALAASIALIVLTWTILSSYRLVLTDTATASAQNELSALANQIDAKNLEAMTIAKLMALSQQNGGYGEHKQSLAFAREILEHNKDLQGAYFGYESNSDKVKGSIDNNCCTNGRFLPYLYRDNNSIALAPLLDMSTSLYYQGPKANLNSNAQQLGIITEPYEYEGTGIVEHVYPIKINGKFAGIAGVDRKLDGVLDLFSHFQPFESSSSFLISRLDKFITTTNDTKKYSMQPVANFTEYQRMFASSNFPGGSGVNRGVSPVTGEDVFIIYSTIKTGDWKIAMTVDVDEVLQPVYTSINKAIFVAIVLILILVFIIYNVVNYLVSKPLSVVVDSLAEIAQGEGDLTARVEVKSDDELGLLALQFNTFVSKQADLIHEIHGASNNVSEGAGELGKNITEIKNNMSNQEDEGLQISAAVTQMSATSREVAQSVSRVATGITDVSDLVDVGQKSVHETVTSITKLKKDVDTLSVNIIAVSESANNIGSVLQVINGIAEQTNLLALNAAIEAARAGEQGRGFAVVADEVRTLAQRTQMATSEIDGVIETLQQTTKSAVDAMAHNQTSLEGSITTSASAGESLDSITKAIQAIDDLATQISVAAEEQSATSGEIDSNMHRIADSIFNANTQLDKAKENINSLEDAAGTVNNQISRFKY
ncbi:MAG: methyl-accepting chemotaxis protein [Saccharospirillaceae bacterium]|nr:methyl-accepting chemotaxis protein [Pseudomonadales bacterium]NRB77560.1 methyl-accepting chemotaxis protein [Saccharospirillaceae bacterium]